MRCARRCHLLGPRLGRLFSRLLGLLRVACRRLSWLRMLLCRMEARATSKIGWDDPFQKISGPSCPSDGTAHLWLVFCFVSIFVRSGRRHERCSVGIHGLRLKRLESGRRCCLSGIFGPLLLSGGMPKP